MKASLLITLEVMPIFLGYRCPSEPRTSGSASTHRHRQDRQVGGTPEAENRPVFGKKIRMKNECNQAS